MAYVVATDMSLVLLVALVSYNIVNIVCVGILCVSHIFCVSDMWKIRLLMISSGVTFAARNSGVHFYNKALVF